MQAERSRAQEATAYLYSKWDVLQSAQTFNELVSRALSRRSALRQLKYQFKESQRLARELVVQQQQARVAQVPIPGLKGFTDGALLPGPDAEIDPTTIEQWVASSS